MNKIWPHFRLTGHDGRSAVWEGVLAPDKREHLVRISYRVPLAIENKTPLSAQPLVQVLQPTLEQHPAYEVGPIPHVYWGRESGEPYLCLFDPIRLQWGIDDLIAETTVYWADEWLYFYEGWLVTKRWRGGGTHPVASNDDGQKHLEAV